MVEKRRHIYKAITEALAAFEDRHYISARQHFAPLLGLRGPNAHIMLSNLLNFTSYSMMSKKMHIDQVAVITEELTESGDRDIALKMWDQILDAYGFKVTEGATSQEACAIDVTMVFKTALDIDRKHGTLAQEILQALEDGVVEEYEIETIEKAAYELRAAVKMLESIIEQFKKAGR